MDLNLIANTFLDLILVSFSDTDLDKNLNSDLNLDTNLDTDLDLDSDLDADLNSDMDSDLNLDTDLDTDMDSDLDSDLDLEIGLDSDAYSTFLFAVRSPKTKEKVVGRLRMFFDFIGIPDGLMEQRSRAFIEKGKDNQEWVFGCILKYLQSLKEKA